MRVPRIYQPVPLNAGDTIKLDAQATTHVARVLRLKQDDPVTVFNGSGGEFYGVITALGKREISIKLLKHDAPDNESPLYITLIQGVSRGERMDYTLQKAVELGVSEIYPVFTEHTAVHINDERKEKKHFHWQGVVNSACEQSGRNFIPMVNPPVTLYQCLDQLTFNNATMCLVLNHRASHSLSTINQDRRGKVALVAGPEGGFSESEITELERRDFLSVKMGPRVLRTETAALAAISILQSMWGDFS